MKKYFFMALIAIVINSCSEDETPIVVDFEAKIEGESPDAELLLENNSSGADSYKWLFGEGANVDSSFDEAPTGIKIDKAGDFSVTLVASNGSSEKELTKNATVSGNTAIITYEDIEFANTPGSITLGRFFIVETWTILKDDEVTEENGPLIDFAYNQFSPTNTVGFFSSPDSTYDEFYVPGARPSHCVNYVDEEVLTVAQFDAMEDDELINDLEIVGDESARGMHGEYLILFRTADEQKGVIKTKGLTRESIFVDIKVQKY